MKNVCTYLLIKSSVLSVTDQQKPVYSDFSANSALDFSYEEKLEAFNDSFIKVDNPEVAIRAITAPIQNKVTGLYDDGLYPVDGIEFEVKPEDWKKLCGYGREYCMEDDMCQCPEVKSEKLAVVSLIDAKEKEQSGEPGNEEKKEACLWQTVNPNKPKYAMSTNLTTEGMDVNWIDLWCEIENWYGDHTKRETAEQLLTRLQKKFNVTNLK